MKKQSLLVLAGLIISTVSLFAQYDKGDKLLNVGVGLNTRYSGSLPIVASFEYGFTDKISVGAGMDFVSTTYGTNVGRYGYNVFTMGARGSYHLNDLFNLDIERLDIYCGGFAGYRFFSWKETNITGAPTGNAYGSSVVIAAHVGARYYFTPMVGAFAEVSVSGAVAVNSGLAFKF